jgi:hypothetical protein
MSLRPMIVGPGNDLEFCGAGKQVTLKWKDGPLTDTRQVAIKAQK